MKNKRFPLFVDLTGRKAVVVGGGNVGLRRARALRDFGADVTVISPEFSGPAEGMRRMQKPYGPNDLAGAYIVVAATDDPAVNAAVGREARALGAFFNRSDCPEDCDFFFPAVCEGGNLVAGVTGDGSDHRRVALAAEKIRIILNET